MNTNIIQVFSIGLTAFLLSACQPESKPETSQIEPDEQPIHLTIRNPKIEIAESFEEMVFAYEEENPHVTIDIHTVGGAVDDLADLKADIAAGNGPDIFTNSGYETARRWENYLEDLSDQPWVDQAYDKSLEPMTFNGQLHGMPINLEGYGFIYNKALFDQAGIETLPDTRTELLAATEKLQAAGITPFATGYYEEWKLGDHLMNVAFAQQKDPDAFIQRLNDGTDTISHNPLFSDVIDLLDMTLQYGNENPLTTDYNMEVELFSTGQTAMIQQGNWVQPMIDQQSPDMNIGFLPIPLNDHLESELVVSVPNYWVVNKQAAPEKKKEAKKFLNWMVSSKKGQQYMTERFQFIPAFKNIESDHLGALADETIQAYQSGNALHANWFHFPPGIKEEFGTAMQLYIGKQLTREQLLEAFQQSWERASQEQRDET